ncbi:MAG TPA: serine/threonine-protein kinase [Polyangiaceae bacterium]
MKAAEPIAEAPPVEAGQIIGGKFRVERIIGEGGMGIVAEATHLQLDERVALKFLRREVMKMPDVVARFDAEARAAVKLKSEHVARVSDVGHTAEGIPFMVMELLDGADLGRAVADRGPLPIREACEYIIQACEGVGEAHARGIVHRDIKPENLFVVQRGDWGLVKVLDFGISKTALVGPSSIDMSSRETTSIMGSPFYMSPEQLRSTKSVDHRSDVWSLGVVLFELLTGGTIFDETKEFTELVADILETPHRKLCRFRRDAPPELESVIDRCLEKDRAKRFQNVAELAVALLPFAPRRSRVTVERIAAITRAAGLLTDPSFQLPPSNFPGPNSLSAGLSSTVPPFPAVPQFDRMSDLGTGVGASGHPMSGAITLPQPISVPSAPRSTPSLVSSTSIEEAPPTQKKKGLALFALVGAALLVGLVILFFVTKKEPPPTNATEPSGTASALASVTPAASAAITATADPIAPATADSAKTQTAPTAKTPTVKNRPPPVVPPPVTAKPSASAVPSQARPSLDIQMER